MFKLKLVIAATLLSAGLTAVEAADKSKSKPAKTSVLTKGTSADLLTPERFEQLETLIKPAEGESRWAEIPWLIDVYEARKKAAEEGKPIYLWSAGGCPPIGGC
jgi:hypothetical protein